MTFEHINDPVVLDKVAIRWDQEAAKYESMQEPSMAAACAETAKNARLRARELRGE